MAKRKQRVTKMKKASRAKGKAKGAAKNASSRSVKKKTKLSAKAPKKILKKKAIAKTKPSRSVERREFRRYSASNLWVTESSGDYQFVCKAANISEGGIFLTGRIKTSNNPSDIRIRLKDGAVMELKAQPLYDRMSNRVYGTAYRFIEMSVAQTKILRGLFRNLD